ncbi:MAG: ABC transporter ATP-binding protein [Lachnospiraceae bacterium]|nr:ABC transporter ATP-binding protein [Lachnospiraceae bacterium]
MFGKDFQRKYALTDQGVKNTKQGTLFTVVVNLVVMGGMGILYFLMTKFMDALTTGAPLPNAFTYILLVLAFVVLSLITHMQQYRTTYGLVYSEVKAVRISIAERLRKLPLGYFGKRDLADLTETIMGDVNRLEHVWSHCLGYLYGSYISTAIIAVGLFCYNWKLAIACLWGVPVAFALLFGSRKLAKKNSEVTKAAGIRVSDGIQETLENIREIRATNQEERFLNELNAKIDHHEKTMIKGELSTGIFVNAASVIMRLGVATTILTGTSMILSGQIDFMLLFMFLLVITRVYAPFDQALALIAEMFMSQVSASRLMEIYDAKTADGADSFAPDGHDIVFENVGFAYKVNSGEAGREGGLGHDNEQVLRGVSFTAKEGEVTALVGPSGSGKSTCARLAARLWDIDSGTIRVGGVNIADIDPETLLTDYSMVFQDVVLFDDTVMENIRLGKHGASDEEVLAAARAANCDEFVEKLPQGYATPIGENGAKLSGGERQRISIARALLKNAPIVLLDEATASLDVENETKVQGALSRLLAGKTVLVIAHRMRTVEAADKIVVLSDGKVAEEGSPAELFAKENSLFRRMTQLQNASAGWSI